MLVSLINKLTKTQFKEELRMSYFNVEKVKYEGPKSKNPFSFKYYNADEKINGKTMAEHLRFSVAYWHTFTEDLSDPFEVGS